MHTYMHTKVHAYIHRGDNYYKFKEKKIKKLGKKANKVKKKDKG
jgi:hypothetical protein